METIDKIVQKLDGIEKAIDMNEQLLVQKGLEIKRVAELVERLKFMNALLARENSELKLELKIYRTVVHYNFMGFIMFAFVLRLALDYYGLLSW